MDDGTELVGDFECGLGRGAVCDFDEEVVLDSEDERTDQCHTKQVKPANEPFNAKGAGANSDVLELDTGDFDATCSWKGDQLKSYAKELDSSDVKCMESQLIGKRNQLKSYAKELDSSDVKCTESQLPTESSPDNALRFVESFLSYGNFSFSPQCPSTKMTRERSRVFLPSKGIQDVAKRISLIRSTEDMDPFDWVDTGTAEEGADVQASLYSGKLDKRFSKVKSAAMCPQSTRNEAFPTEFADDLESVYLKKHRVASVRSDSALLPYISDRSGQTSKVAGDTVQSFGNGDFTSNLVAEEEDDDVGFCTQMAAEVMEALSHAPSCITTDFHEVQWQTPPRSPQELNAHVAGSGNLASKENVFPNSGQTQLPAKKQRLNKAQNANVSTNRPPRRNRSNPSGVSGRRAVRFKKRTEDTGYVNSNQMEELDHRKGKLPSSKHTLSRKKMQQEDMISSSAINRSTRQLRSGTNLKERVKDSENCSGRWPRSSMDSNNLKRSKQQTDVGLSLLSRLDTCSYPKRKRTKCNIQRGRDGAAGSLYAVTVAKGRKNLQMSEPDVGNHFADMDTEGNDLTSSDYQKEPCKKRPAKSYMSKELVRLGANESTPDFTWKNLRKKRYMAHVRVLLSLHLGDSVVKKQKEILAKLHIPTATSSSDASHFIADKFTRTRNMLEFIAEGKPVVTHLWLEHCELVGSLVDEKNFILRDAIKEKELGFNMATSLARAAKHPLLEGRKVFITSNIKPDKEMITSLVKAVRGQVINRRQIPITEQGRFPDDILILSCIEDKTAYTPFLKKGAKIYTSELILSGIVAQKLDYRRHELVGANSIDN